MEHNCKLKTEYSRCKYSKNKLFIKTGSKIICENLTDLTLDDEDEVDKMLVFLNIWVFRASALGLCLWASAPLSNDVVILIAIKITYYLLTSVKMV